MSLNSLLIAAAAALACGPALAQHAAAEPAQSATAAQNAAARFSPERLAAIRSALVSRVAVYDSAENAMRQPTAAEAAALAPKASNTAPRLVTLPSGGLALRQDASNIEYLIVDIGADGKKTMRHGSADSVGAKAATQSKEQRHAR
jgi:hypothetical protein